MKTPIPVLLFIFSVVVLLCCKKESFINSEDARISISVDTLHYDTVFTTTGSITQKFKVINLNNQKLLLTHIKLMGGSGSFFHMNVDGIATDDAQNLELAANDSIYVFVNVTIDPNSANLPFVVQDSIEVSFNGNQQLVQLQAYGQNAHFLKNAFITANTSFGSDLPYVILGALVVDTGVTLNLDPGCRMYVHANAPLIIDGSLVANGTKADSIVFRGDRLDPDYKDLPASWPGIFFRASSNNNSLTHAHILNAYQAVVLDQPASTTSPKVTLNACVIDNAYDAGILSLNSSLKAENCLISNCGINVLLANGGNYEFDQCTVASYSNIYLSHKQPVLAITNWDSVNNQVLTYPLSANFQNCIFWGDYGTVTDEVITSRRGTDPFTINFNHVLYKAQTVPSDITFVSPILNEDPFFDLIDPGGRIFDFHLNRNPSPAIKAGADIGVTTDLDDLPRIPPPDLGCYQKQ